MKPILTPNKSLNKAYRRQKISRGAIDSFKINLNHLLNELDEKESEEHLKNDVTQFLNDTWYKGEFLINTKGRTDLVIHNDKTAKSSVGVLLEVKKPSNKSEMVSEANLNKKALQELLLYYLRERVEGENNDIKHLVVTNVYEWFIFDASVFYKHFYEDKALIKSFKAWDSGQKDSTKTELFYKEIAGPAIEKVKENLEYTHFDLKTYTKYLEKEEDSSKLINLFKLLSPTHLLKQPFANDSNSLNKQFYGELLHIIGLEEIKEGGKKVIQRKAEGKRNEGSLLENAVTIMEERDRLRNLDRPSRFGDTYSEQLYNVALELSITWTNRILFLKLLESQLVGYHKGDKSYKFLSSSVIPNYDALDQLFFGVLAKKHDERRDQVKEKFAKIPYLNSSLFEPTELEGLLEITQLDNNIDLDLFSQTVLKTDKGKKQSGSKPTLNYLFEFLEAYDFSSEGTEEIQEDSKTLINASVLGLIFEKINGYKDGSFYTPGFITMYMCKETIRRTVVQKFNETKGWELKDFAQLYDKIDDKAEANQIINSLHICDPAVGSGHFLVSALNEIIAIKSELKILMDKEGKTLRDYDISIANDELVIEDDNGNFFQYATGSKEKQRIQETLFQEKQTIIENCLFGVDINPNSVKICRLRLWIELLKNAYYKNETELETLPNIDINIKCGNSLISRFDLDVDIKEALKRSKWTIDSYKIAVDTYRNAQSKEEKRQMERLIDDIKTNFRSEISKNDKKVKELYKLNGEMANLTTQTSMFEMSAKEKKEWSKKVETLSKSIQKLDTQIEEIKSNKIYDNAFEWRFEFPEVLNDDGEFVGFDAVIGNPPYIRIQDLNASSENQVKYYNESYVTTGKGNYDLYVPFVEKGVEVLKKSGRLCYIMPHKFINSNYGSQLRGFIGNSDYLEKMVHFGAAQVFEDATTYTGLFFISKKQNQDVCYSFLDAIEAFRDGSVPLFNKSSNGLLTSEQWMFLESTQSELLEKIQESNETLETKTDRIFQGVKTSADKIFIVQYRGEKNGFAEVHCKENNKIYLLEKQFLIPLIKGGDSRSFHISQTDLLLIFPYRDGELVTSETIQNEAPNTWSYLNDHKVFLESREKKSFIGPKWYMFGRSQALSLIQEPKIFTPDIAPSPRFSLDEEGKLTFTGGAAGGYGIIPTKKEEFKFLLAILNSKVAFWYITKTSTQMRGGWYSFESRYIKSIPIPIPSKDQLQEIDSVVDRITRLKKHDPSTDTTTLEAEIDQLVYAMYGLTDEEIAIVEEGTK
ncbi:MAG: Eco57I restriction-modification methylase domain-containing protein [Reichenbachiella sp.]|uniref:DUF7149 domain-containing protein n=1 Tax=Reichenbachiella sp. TaxID=2184521 RepID=UPI0032969FEA